MVNRGLPDVDVALLYIENIPSEYFDDFHKLADGNGLDILEEFHENVPYSALEWVVSKAIAFYIGMKFIDAFIKRVTDAAYPKFKAALVNLVKTFSFVALREITHFADKLFQLNAT